MLKTVHICDMCNERISKGRITLHDFNGKEILDKPNTKPWMVECRTNPWDLIGDPLPWTFEGCEICLNKIMDIVFAEKEESND